MSDEHSCRGAFDGCAACQGVHDECLRVERWHATYNAALTGLHAFSSDLHQNGFGVEDSHEMALQAANLAHGPLVKP
jgi:hypothetical protein